MEQFAAIRRDHQVDGLSIRGAGRQAWCASAHGAPGVGVAGGTSTVRWGCRIRRCAIMSASAAPQILAEAGKPLELGFVPRTHEPGPRGRSTFRRNHCVPMPVVILDRGT